MIILPLACHAEYHPDFLSQDERVELFEYLDGLDALKERAFKDVSGNEYKLAVGTYLFADAHLLNHERLPYVMGPREAWTPLLESIKGRAEMATGRRFSVGPCVYYESGDVGICFHRDFMAYGSVDVIASLSIGQERTFAFRRQDNHSEQCELNLADGSLLIMGCGCQELYEHNLPEMPTARGVRFNLSFRQFGTD